MRNNKEPTLQIIVVSGLSGAGKSVALRCFEDLGFFCVDNLPPPLLATFIDLCAESSHRITRIALGVDIRERIFFEDFIARHRQLINRGYEMTVLFLEAQDAVLLRRFSESRRPHPLAPDRPVREGIAMERQRLAQLRAQADQIIDTTNLTVHELKATISRHYRSKPGAQPLQLILVSFGYKFGLPSELDLLFDARCLPNPHFVEELKHFSGDDPQVRSFLLGHAQTKHFLDQLCSFLEFLLPQYEQEGRSYLTVGVGCTGGRHRSVLVVTQLAEYLRGKGYHPTVRHRDMTPRGGLP